MADALVPTVPVRLVRHVPIRLLMAGLIVYGALIAKFFVGLRMLNIHPLLVLAFVILIYDAIAWVIIRRWRDRGALEEHSLARRVLRWTLYVAIVFDLICLTVGIWIAGGTRSPFLPFALLPLILSGILLPWRAALSMTLISYMLLAMLVIGEWSGLIQTNPTGAPLDHSDDVDGLFAITVLFVYGCMFGMATFAVVTVTEFIRQRERSVRQANAQTERYAGILRNFLYIAIHDIKSPIGAALTFMSNLLDGLAEPLAPKQSEWVRRSADRLASVTDLLSDLQTLASLNAGEFDQQKEQIEVGDLLQALVDDHKADAEELGISLSLQFGRSLPPLVGIRRLIREAVANLITNGLKYTPSGGRVMVRAMFTDHGDIRIEVEDTGIGISESDQQRIFEEFYRVRKQKVSEKWVPGSGLGLAIVREIVDIHRGQLGVSSRPGEGSTFVLDFPALRFTELT